METLQCSVARLPGRQVWDGATQDGRGRDRRTVNWSSANQSGSRLQVMEVTAPTGEVSYPSDARSARRDTPQGTASRATTAREAQPWQTHLQTAASVPAERASWPRRIRTRRVASASAPSS